MKILPIFLIFIIMAIYHLSGLTEEEDKEINYSDIPKLTKVIICAESFEEVFNFNNGDIIEIIGFNKDKKYYICSRNSFYKLTKRQISLLEFDYHIKIM